MTALNSEKTERPAESRKVSLAEFYPVLKEILDSGSSFRLPVTGTSMYPTILGGRDTVKLVKPKQPLKKYDLPLYRREKSGQFVLHRIVRVEKDGSYTCCGDHQWELERGVRPEQIIGVASELCRKGRTFSADKPRYRCWVRFWVWVLPLRRPILRAARVFSGLRRGRR